MSTAPQNLAAPSLEVIFDALNGYQRTAALRGAIELDLFTAIAEGNTTAKLIAKRIQASEKGTRVLCDFLTVMGFLTKQDNAYGLTQEAAIFLNRHSPAYMGSIGRFLGNPDLTTAFSDMAALVRKGGTLMEGEGSVEPNNPLWVDFARSMAPMMTLPAQLIADLLEAKSGAPWKVLDIAAGHGLFGIELAKQNPNAHITAVDWEAVLAVARENAEKAGVSARYSTKPGSAFEADFGSGYDLVLLTNFLHHFDPPTNETLLKKVHAALAPGGRAVTLEFVPNDDRISPATPAMFSMMMLGSTAHGDAYTFRELDRMFRNAGFVQSELREIAPSPQRVVVSYK
ncbi:MAG TPA: class I SAM-dependent methyltransferase [Bryobacteraceae bacterium]|nr:class I SAM-dependent methyltransferase [Bryobacteraceae bacterium]